jgi:hypothetical protein
MEEKSGIQPFLPEQLLLETQSVMLIPLQQGSFIDIFYYTTHDTI